MDKFKRVLGKYGIRRAFLFGSVIEQSCMPHSDIDIYVEDLEGKRYWDLWRDLEELANRPVDLYYQLDDPVFVKKIKERGELIYEG